MTKASCAKASCAVGYGLKCLIEMRGDAVGEWGRRVDFRGGNQFVEGELDPARQRRDSPPRAGFTGEQRTGAHPDELHGATGATGDEANPGLSGLSEEPATVRVPSGKMSKD